MNDPGPVDPALGVAHGWVEARAADLTADDVGGLLEFEAYRLDAEWDEHGGTVFVSGTLVASRRTWTRLCVLLTVLPEGGGDVVVHHVSRGHRVAVWR